MEIGYKKYKLGEYKDALKFFMEASEIAKLNNSEVFLCESIKMEATALYRLARYTKSERKFIKALDIAKKMEDEIQEAKIY